MATSRMHTWLGLVVLSGVLLAVGLFGLWTYMSATATPMHPNPAEVASVTRSAPPARWAGAVARAREVARAAISEQNLPGLSVAAGVDGEVVWAEGLGWAEIDHRVAVTPQTRFRTGGVSMALTSAVAGLLVEAKQLKLDDEIQAYVPTYPRKQWPLTVRQLMAHMGGVVSDRGDEEPLSERCGRTIDVLPRFSDSALRFEPGTAMRFSTYGWTLVSAAVEAAAGEPFFAVVRDRLLTPLGMSDTSPDSEVEPPPNRASFYHPRFAADTRYGPETARSGDYACFAGAGGFVTTPSDLVRFGLAVSGGKLLEPATVTLLHTPQRLSSGEATGYGLGWELETATLAGESVRVVGHDSRFTNGGSASLLTFPDRGIVVAVTTNTSFADAKAIALKVAEAFATNAGTPRGK